MFIQSRSASGREAELERPPPRCAYAAAGAPQFGDGSSPLGFREVEWNRVVPPYVGVKGARKLGGLEMLRLVAAFFLLLASALTASAQGLFPSVWQTQRGAILKVLWVDAAGNFSGVFITSPGAPCPGVPYNLVGRIRGPLVFFQTSRSFTSDCNVTTNWSGHFVSPTTVVARGSAIFAGRRIRGTEVFQRI